MASSVFVPFVLLLFLLALNIKQSVSDPRTTEAALICTNRTAIASDRQVFVASFLAAMDSISPIVSRQGYGEVINGTGNNTVYAFGECMKDLSQTDCNLCFAQCKTQILRCLPFQRLIRGGRLFYDGCYIRYDDYMFFNDSMDAFDRTVCGPNDFSGNRSLFGENVLELVRDLRFRGVRNDGFSVGNVSRGNLTVFGLAQCWDSVSGEGCDSCLADSVSKIGSCPPKDEGRVLNAGCYMRYSTQRFYFNTSTNSTSTTGGRSRRLAIILATTFSALALLVIVALTSFFTRKRVLKQRRVRKQLGALLQTVNKSKLNFSYETLEKATNYFKDSNKLGQGASGTVYKGNLPNGQIVAIKRLFFNSTQWVDHFFNEVNLISGIDHKNLVKLLGCSITGPESLLVYEYVSNQSLHDHMSIKKNVHPRLKWEDRYKIILGTAEGLSFLHEESTVRIIHRDIKLSNVLLDEDFTPKIADFGLARLFPEDKTHVSTAIAGTMGYMAPEYVVRGVLTEKADVYSFGVLVIEVVSGRRNNDMTQNSYSILQKVWNLYGTPRLSEVVDPSLQGKFPEKEAIRLLEIGLLCVQASPETRPRMSQVVKMLIDEDEDEIPKPTQPPFLNSSSSFEMGLNKQRIASPYFQSDSYTQSSGNDLTESWIEPR